jgi:hypothetical protein
VMAVFVTSISALLFLAVGVVHLVWATGIARFYRRLHESNRLFRIVSPFGAWIQSSYYETALRAIGALMVCLAVLLFSIMIRGLLGG